MPQTTGSVLEAPPLCGRDPSRPPVYFEIVLVDRDFAAELYQNRAPNRGISLSRIKKLKRIIRENRLRFLGDPIRIDWNGQLRDGQHRIRSCMEALEEGQTVPFLFMFNVDPADQVAYDDVRSRTAADEFARLGYSNTTMRQAVVRALIQWDHNSIGSWAYAPDNEEIVKYHDDHLDEIEDGIVTAFKVTPFVPLIPSIVAAVRMKTMEEDHRLSEAFFREFIYTEEREGNPVLALVRLAKRRAAADRRRTGEILENPDRLETLYYLSKAWDAYRSGRSVDKLQRPRTKLAMRHIPHVGKPRDPDQVSGSDDDGEAGEFDPEVDEEFVDA